MEFIVNFFNEYGPTLLYAVLMAILSYAGLKLKSLLEEYLNVKTKKEVVKTVCEATDQLYGTLSGEEKLNKAVENTRQMLSEKGIKYTDLELRIYIESAVSCIKKEKEVK